MPEAAEATPEAGFSLGRRIAAEALGTALLLAIVIGSGVMGERLAGGNVALALLANALATGAGLIVLITVFGPISGAHFNPVVTLVACGQRNISAPTAAAYVAAQLCGAVIGVWTAHAMFGLPILEVSAKLRDGPALAFSELVATFGLIVTILGSSRQAAPMTVGLYITAAYWFTASTAFANPAVTLARTLSDTFAGIAPVSAPLFIAAQLAGGGLAMAVFGWMARPSPRPPST